MLHNNKTLLCSATALMAAMLATGSAQAGETMDAVKERGQVVCGVSTGLPGFSTPDDQGNWEGIDVDVCHGVGSFQPSCPNRFH
ncbi:general L-amino acid transport system substrate-binding protein [Onishia taeanensis]|uniref:General L-amino acid transport system substrate-binding protein n=1 Tax=Onishia taeanensis TaxID=284577 RepID=A0A328XVE9_9GAMM|nr:hypothetical protein [Halomonas taeanensis]RAR59625.1 general L-amino acid transport system substrate-binding protein [Halomonas taeanensis]